MIDALEENGESSGSIGFICGLLILTGGIVSVATRKKDKKGGNIALIIIFGLAALIGFTGYGNYQDLVVWSAWALVNVAVAVIALFVKKKKSPEVITQTESNE